MPGTKEEREVDVLSIESRYLMEATSFLSLDKGLSKIRRLAQTRAGLEKVHNINLKKTFFVSYGIDSQIKDQFYELMDQHNMIPIIGSLTVK